MSTGPLSGGTSSLPPSAACGEMREGDRFSGGGSPPTHIARDTETPSVTSVRTGASSLGEGAYKDYTEVIIT